MLTGAAASVSKEQAGGRLFFEKGRKMLNEFKEFIAKGNVMDLAVGVIIGGAFALITASMVDDLIMPIVGMAGSSDFSNYFIGLSDAVTATNLEDAKKQGPVFAYGNFITVVVKFIIIAFVIFLLVRYVNRVKAASEEPATEEAPAAPAEDIVLLTEIRDALRK